jgi:hypothetical protein
MVLVISMPGKKVPGRRSGMRPSEKELQNGVPPQNTRIIIIIIISCHRFSLFPGTSALEPVVNPTTQASSLSL